jgi:hypothetical protein
VYEARRKESAVKDLWAGYVRDTLLPEIESDPSFRDEVSLYGDNVVAGLLN